MGSFLSRRLTCLLCLRYRQENLGLLLLQLQVWLRARRCILYVAALRRIVHQILPVLLLWLLGGVGDGHGIPGMVDFDHRFLQQIAYRSAVSTPTYDAARVMGRVLLLYLRCR